MKETLVGLISGVVSEFIDRFRATAASWELRMSTPALSTISMRLDCPQRSAVVDRETQMFIGVERRRARL